MSFKDHFSGYADRYAACRPLYSPAVFDFVAALPRRRCLAWDCGTGNGQAAQDLAARFERVIATDASARQLAHARPHPRIEFRQALAESSGLAAGSVDLVAAAAAVHWFDLDRFYAEVQRVLAPGGALAVWTYDVAQVSTEVDSLVQRMVREIIAPFWPPERRWVDEEYRTLPFPFAEIEIPPLSIEERWDLERFLKYLGTWSASFRYLETTGREPQDVIRQELTVAWGDPHSARTIRWPLMMRAGYPYL